MGVSTDAKLVWGFNVDRDADYEACESLDAFMDERYSELDAAEKKYGGDLVWHCSDSHQSYIVGLKATYTSASRGYPEEIRSLDLPDDAQAKLDAFAEALGMKPQPGKWLLCSYWG